VAAVVFAVVAVFARLEQPERLDRTPPAKSIVVEEAPGKELRVESPREQRRKPGFFSTLFPSDGERDGERGACLGERDCNTMRVTVHWPAYSGRDAFVFSASTQRPQSVG
jgi:hypothetical protein